MVRFSATPALDVLHTAVRWRQRNQGISPKTGRLAHGLLGSSGRTCGPWSGRPWPGQCLDSAKTALGLIHFLLSLVLSWRCLGALVTTRCPNLSGRLCRPRTPPSRSGPEGLAPLPAEHGGHGQQIARPESRAGVGPEWHLVTVHISEPERLTHQRWVFGCDVSCRVSQQDKGKRLGFSAGHPFGPDEAEGATLPDHLCHREVGREQPADIAGHDRTPGGRCRHKRQEQDLNAKRSHAGPVTPGTRRDGLPALAAVAR